VSQTPMSRQYIQAEVSEEFSDARVRVIRRITPGLGAACAMAYLSAGSWFDPPGKRGLSHFYEHAFFAGAGDYQSAQSIAEAVSDLGCAFNAHTYREHSHYYISGPCTTSAEAVDLLMTCYVAPRFDSAELDKQRTAIQNELRHYVDHRERRLRDLVSQALFGPEFGASPLGTSTDVSALGPDDLRWYAWRVAVPERLSIVIDAPDENLPALERLRSWLPSLPDSAILPAPQVSHGEPVNVNLIDRSRIALGALVVPGVSYELSRREMYAIRLFHTVLGAGPASRLLTLLRDRLGYSYQVSTALEPHADTGALLVIFGCAPDALREVLTHVWDELRRSLEGPIGERELMRAREINRGIHVAERETSVSRCKVTAHDVLRRGELCNEEDMFGLWGEIPADEVLAVAQRCLRLDDVRFAAVTPSPAEDLVGPASFLAERWEQAQ
jgi:zinc protease